MLAWLMKTPLAIKQLEKLSHGYLEMDCSGGKCYGVLAVRCCQLLLSSLYLSHIRSTESVSPSLCSTSYWVPL